MPSNAMSAGTAKIERVAVGMLEELAARFPVCTASDEFHFFPQILGADRPWSRWDDFSSAGVATVCDQLREWQQRLADMEAANPIRDDQIDIQLMRRVIQTLHEQLAAVGAHRRQPSFHLTVMGIGLAEAIDAGSQALRLRLQGLPAFLDRARSNLHQVPVVFNRLGLEMIKRFQPWLAAFPQDDALVAPVQAALARLAHHLKQLPTVEEFLPSVEIYARIASAHMGCRVSMDELAGELDQEIATTEGLLQHYAGILHPGRRWQAVVDSIETPLADIDTRQGYQQTIEALASHCVDNDLIPAGLPAQSPVKVEIIPDFMRPVRSNAAFSATPGHPARGGTFFIEKSLGGQAMPVDYRLLSAHETYPGHHVLDSSRWNLARPVRRHIEFPLFYEGWASFSEELLFDTGFFHGPLDQLLMAKRRFWRAVRGRVDFDIHMRRRDLSQAAAFLGERGRDPTRAKAMVQRYILKPGYQLAYAVGRRRFRRLYGLVGGAQRPAAFARSVLAQGEIDFDQLETILMQGG